MIDVENILEKMKPNQKINYDWVMQQMVKQWQASDIRPKILMHVCCAPCSTYTLEYLSQWADVTIYFANSNIHPKDEYYRREYVTQKFVHDFNKNTGYSVQFLSAPYEPNEFSKKFMILSIFLATLKKIKVTNVPLRCVKIMISTDNVTVGVSSVLKIKG